MKKLLSLTLAATLCLTLAACSEGDTKTPQEPQEAENMQNSDCTDAPLVVDCLPPTTSTWAQVVEITSERSFIVEVIAPRTSWWDAERHTPRSRDFGGFLIGDIVEVKYDEYDRWVLPVIENTLEKGSIIEFHRSFTEYVELTDYTQEPFVTWAMGLVVYVEDNDWSEQGWEEVVGLRPVYDNPYFQNRHSA